MGGTNCADKGRFGGKIVRLEVICNISHEHGLLTTDDLAVMVTKTEQYACKCKECRT